ncbi:MAG: ABC transporter substrate-binding protein [Sphaerochaetaceae bacterium]
MKKLGIVLIVLTAFAAFPLVAQGVQEKPVSLQVAMGGNPDTLDPHKTAGTLTFQTIRSFYDTLVEPNENGKIVPALAESWDVSSDNLVWTFHLRSGVTFHNGDTFTSTDVKKTLERIMDPSMASSKASEFGSIESIETPDDLTVVVVLSSPSAPLLSTLASGWGAILPASLIDEGHDFGQQPVGTGPFKLQEWIPDNSITLEKNDAYWMSGKPAVDEVKLNIIPEPAVQLQGLISGQLDVLSGYTPTEQELQMLKSNADINVTEHLTAMVLVLAINTSHDYIDSLKLRQAIAMSIDKQKVLDIAYGGGEPVGTFMDITDPYYEDYTDLYPYNPDQATSIIKSLNIPKDTVFTMALPQNYDMHVKAGQLYQEMLEKVGLNVQIKLVDWSTWLSDVYRGGNYDFTVIGHTGKLDPSGRLSGYGVPDTNYVKWDNAEAAEAINKAAQIVDFDQRKALYGRALELMAEELPHIYIGTSYSYVFNRANVSGFRMDTKLDTFDFRNVTVDGE